MDSDLFFKWFRDIFIPHCGSARPVLLLLDNHESHISIEVIQLARANKIEILGFPAHTTHILQPLDVSINGPLKAQVYKTATNLGFVNKHQILNKAKFPAVLSASIDKFCSPANIKGSFRKSGIFPYNPDAIDKCLLVSSHSKTLKLISNESSTLSDTVSGIVPSTSPDLVPLATSESTSSTSPDPVPSTSVEPIPSTSSDIAASTSSDPTLSTKSKSNTSICAECGLFLGGNPLVTEGLISSSLSHIFPPVPAKPMPVKRKMVTEARVITSDEFIKRLEEKEMEAKVKKEQITKRKQEREERKQQKEAEQEQKKMKKGTKMKTSDEQQRVEVGRPGKKRAKKNIVVCKICRLAFPESGEGDIDWVQCELCDEWCHLECSDITAEEIEEEEVCFKCLVCLELGEE